MPEFEILDHVAKPIFVLRPDAEQTPRFVFWNRACEALGPHSRQDVIGRTAREVFSGRIGETAHDIHMDALNAQSPLSYEFPHQVEGHPAMIQTTLSPWRKPDGGLEAIVGTCVVRGPAGLSGPGSPADALTEVMGLAVQSETRGAAHSQGPSWGQTIARSALRDMTSTTTQPHAQAFDQQANEMEQYLAFAAHDLRAPMRRVNNIAEVIREELPNDATEARAAAALLDELSATAQTLIRDVLNFSEATNAQSSQQEFELATLARDIFMVLDPLSGHRLTVRPARLKADRKALQIVLRNLVDNAIKHCGRTRVTIDVCAQAQDGGLLLTVKDDGPGLPSRDLEFLNGADFAYGHGFGLLGLRRLVARHNGGLSARSAPGNGSEFHIFFPEMRVLG